MTKDTQPPTTESLLERRAKLLGPNVPTFYDQPLHLVKGKGVWVWDAQGRKYLDCYNNVPHVGHCHPRVVEAIYQQASTLKHPYTLFARNDVGLHRAAFSYL